MSLYIFSFDSLAFHEDTDKFGVRTCALSHLSVHFYTLVASSERTAHGRDASNPSILNVCVKILDRLQIIIIIIKLKIQLCFTDTVLNAGGAKLPFRTL